MSSPLSAFIHYCYMLLSAAECNKIVSSFPGFLLLLAVISSTMESVGNPKTWVPYMYTKDCSQGFCSMYCPQWCRMAFPPPPSVDQAENSTKFSPLVITIISVLASCLLLVSYFAIISKYCHRKSSEGRQNHDEEMQDSGVSSFHQALDYATIGGLDQNFIKSIPLREYKKDDNLIEGMDCCVCLGEFHENEMLRMLPKCSHSFHIPCIDMWLKSHSTCPLCRASVTCNPQLCSPFIYPSSPMEIQSA